VADQPPAGEKEVVMATAGEVIQEFANLPVNEQEKVSRAVAALPPVPPKYVGPLWLIVVSAFVVLLLGGAYVLFLLIEAGNPTEVFVPLVTGALGVLAGLLAPSPVANK
jgi:hypothetical protein